MAVIQCTKKLLKELRITDPGRLPEVSSLGHWHANLLLMERRKCVLFTNNETLYSFFVPCLTRPDFLSFDEVFRQNLFRRMRLDRLTQEEIEIMLELNREITYTPTSSRSVLGSMNEFSYIIAYTAEEACGVLQLDIDRLNFSLNEVIMSSIQYRKSVDVLRARLSGLTA